MEAEDTRKYCVYLITNLVNGKQYAGFTFRPEQRWAEHKSKARKGKKKYLYSAMRLYGEKAFDFKIVSSGLTRKEAGAEEIRMIEDLQLRNQKLGYNEAPGGEGGPLTEEIIDRICESRGMKRDPICGNRYFATDLPTEEIIKRYELGESSVDLSKEYKCSSGTILRRLNAAGVALRSASERTKLFGERQGYGFEKNPPKRWGTKQSELTKQRMRAGSIQRRRDVSDEEVVRLYTEGQSSVQIAKKFSMTHPAIQRRLRLSGVKLRAPGRPHSGRS